MPSYDILITGAGPAGCAAAYDLARAGKRVLLLDKRNFPRHKACACGLTRKTLAALRYSVNPVIERVCHEIVLQPADAAAPEVRVKTRNPICAMAVRERFDAFCLEQTLASARNGGSVTLRKIERIAAFRESPTHIELDIVTAEGLETLTAPILIGADGSNGQTRRLTQQDTAPGRDGFALEATVPYTALPATLPGGDGPHDLVFDFSPLPGGYGWLFPKADHINIGVGAFASSNGAISAPSGAQIKQVTRALLLGYTQQKLGVTKLDHITGQQLGMGGHDYIPRGRVLLVGDAAGLVDPLTGEGIHSAIVSGQAAASAILSCAQGESNQANGNNVAAAYAHHLRPLQETLAFSHRAARAFYARPERGFKAMRYSFMRSLILKTYADGLPYTKLLTALAKLTT
ncbi:MAG: geranylgeranyl reductase family protein [Acidobacteriaceae bacterium]